MRKKILFFLALTLVSFLAFSQELITIYLNSKWEVTNQEKAECKCDAEFDLNNFRLDGRIVCFNINGSPRMTVNYKNGIKNGEAKLYSTNGKKIFDGRYDNNYRSDLWHYYYPNENLIQTIKFTKDPELRRIDANIMIGEFYDKDGSQLVKNGNGVWFYDSIYASWGENITLKTVKGFVKDSLKHGVWELRRINKKKVLQSEKFEHGRFITGEVLVERDGGFGTMPFEITNKFPDKYKTQFSNMETFKLDSTVFSDSIRYLETEKLIEVITGIKYKIRNRDAGYLYGDFELMEYIARGINYPRVAKEYGYQGTVIVQLTIDKNGKAKDFKVLRSAHESLNEEAIRVISSIKTWVAGLHNGEPYEKTFAIPVKFQL